jgi:hypothetical protein
LNFQAGALQKHYLSSIHDAVAVAAGDDAGYNGVLTFHVYHAFLVEQHAASARALVKNEHTQKKFN